MSDYSIDGLIRYFQMAHKVMGWTSTDNSYEHHVAEMLKKLRDERDEARRLYCEEWAFTIELERGEAGNPFDLALEKGWDCYLQRKKSDAALDELARLDEELGLIEPPNEGFLQDLG